jgi:hypothetical protein
MLSCKSLNFRLNVTIVAEFNMGNAYLMQDLKSNVCPVAVSIRIESAMNGIKSQSATTTNDVQSVTAIIALKIIKFMYAEKCSARPATYTTHQIDHVLFKPLRSLKNKNQFVLLCMILRLHKMRSCETGYLSMK